MLGDELHNYNEACPICHNFPENCICPECVSCCEVGDPRCINTHMSYKKWPSLYGYVCDYCNKIVLIGETCCTGDKYE